MRIVYDKTQTTEKGLAGWLDSRHLIPENVDLSLPEQALWQRLAPQQIPHNFQHTDSKGLMDFWSHLLMVGDSAESQYDVLRESASGSHGRLACIALRGAGFHGQRNRPWQALTGNLHLSISVPLDLPSGPEAMAWTMLPAVAVLRAMNNLKISEKYGIKWVNDVLVGEDKLAGVISSLSIANGQIQQGFLGIGLNVGQAPGISVDTCCLQQFLLPDEAPLGLVLANVLKALGDLITLFENGQGRQIFQEYKSQCLVVGRRVRIMTDPAEGDPETLYQGKVIGINPDLSLVLEGQASPIRSGRLQLLK